MVLDLLRGKGLQVDSSRSRSRRSLPVYVPKPSTMKKDGGLVLPVDYRSPPFFGSWDKNNMVGYGKPKKKTKKKRQKKGEGLLLGKNSPFKNIPLLNMLL